MLLGTKPGEAYTDADGRMYYDTTDGRTYRTAPNGCGLWEFAQRGQSATWEQIRGTAQWTPLPLHQFAERCRRAFGA